jgi:acyl homoserine lactone synthase
MEHQISTGSPLSMTASDIEGMHRLRHEVFAVKRGWDVKSENGMERDAFDDVPEVMYMVARSTLGRIDACWRLLPTLGPNMLRDTFPELLHGQTAPASADCWELSRFAVATDRAGTSNASVGPVARGLMAESVRFAMERGIERYVTVTTPIMERMLKQTGLHVHRVGPPIRIGIAAAVACFIEIDDQTKAALGISSCKPALNG